MPNSVDLVIGQEAIKQVENLISKLSLADAELLKISQSATTASKGISGISTPSGLDKAVSNTSALNAQLEKQNAIIAKLHADIAKKAEQSRLSEIKLQQSREKAFDSFEKNAQKEAAINAKNTNAYNKTQNQINNLTKAYNDLAVRKARYNDLSAHEEMRLGTLSKVNDKYNNLLRGTDAIIGKNTRNVGNYANGYNALGNSINQLTREAPAFANSVNTGFMALSNNFPALFDAINGIRDKNKMLVAEGKPTVSTLGSIAKAVFSWQTLLSVGVTLLTLYGGQFVKWIGEVARGRETISDLKLRMDTLNKSFEESSVSEAVKNVQELSINIQLAKDGFLDKDKVVNQYNETIGKTTGLVGSLDEAEKELTANGDSYIKMTLFKAAANLALEDAAKQALEAEKSRLKSLKEFEKSVEDVDFSTGGAGGLGTGAFNAEQYESDKKRRLAAQKKRKDDEIKISEDAAQQNLNIAKKFQQDAANIAKTSGFNFFEDTKKEKVKQTKPEKREDIKQLESSLKSIGTTIAQIDAEISRLTTEKIIADQDELPEINEQLNLLIELRKNLNGLPTADFKIKVPAEEATEVLNKLSEAGKNFLGSFTSEFLNNSGLGSLETFFDGTFNDLIDGATSVEEKFSITFNAIAESAQEAFNFISNASQARFDNERSRLDEQYEYSFKAANGNKAAEEKLALDLEKKKKEIDSREARTKQRQAIFNIAIDTAQAVIATLAKTPPPAGIPLAVFVGALGAAQIALVASQKIPQYFMGTDNHQGGLMLVNDGSGSNFQEKVILPNGKEVMPEGRNVLMDAPKGTKVLTHEQQIMQMLNERGISMNASYAQNNGMTANEMDSIMSKHFARIQTNHTSFDKNGIHQWSEKNGNRTIRNSNRGSGVGFKV